MAVKSQVTRRTNAVLTLTFAWLTDLTESGDFSENNVSGSKGLIDVYVRVFLPSLFFFTQGADPGIRARMHAT